MMMVDTEPLIATRTIELVTSIGGAIAYLILSATNFFVIYRRAVRHADVWLLLAATFLARGMVTALDVVQHFHSTPILLFEARSIAALAVMALAAVWTWRLPMLMQTFTTRAQDIAVQQEGLEDIQTVNNLNKHLAETTHERALQFKEASEQSAKSLMARAKEWSERHAS